MVTIGKEQVIDYGQKRLKVIEKPGNRVMYQLQDGTERAFVKEELMLVPENTELPPDYVQGW